MKNRFQFIFLFLSIFALSSGATAQTSEMPESPTFGGTSNFGANPETTTFDTGTGGLGIVDSNTGILSGSGTTTGTAPGPGFTIPMGSAYPGSLSGSATDFSTSDPTLDTGAGAGVDTGTGLGTGMGSGVGSGFGTGSGSAVGSGSATGTGTGSATGSGTGF